MHHVLPGDRQTLKGVAPTNRSDSCTSRVRNADDRARNSDTAYVTAARRPCWIKARWCGIRVLQVHYRHT